MVYINSLITAGIATSKDKKYDDYVEYKPTRKLLKIYWANIKNAKKKSIAQKIAYNTHTSTKDAVKNIRYFNIIFQKDKEMSDKITEELDLDKEEIEWLRK